MNNFQTKLKAILLGKVHNLPVIKYYDLTSIEVDSIFRSMIPNRLVDQSWFDCIEADFTTGNYTWNTRTKPLPTVNQIIEEIVYLINTSPKLITEVMKDIFIQCNEPIEPVAEQGYMSKFNKMDSDERNENYVAKISDPTNPFRQNPHNITVVAEGDSWFLFPSIRLANQRIKDAVLDIGDHLCDEPSIAFYNLAFAGEWLSDMIYQSEYIAALDTVQPDVFLISGGGNDMLSNGRLLNFVKVKKYTSSYTPNPIFDGLVNMRNSQVVKHATFDPVKYNTGLGYLETDFLYFMNTIFIQYLAVFTRIYKNTDKFDKMLTITQGYDYPIPSDNNAKWTEFTHCFINNIVGAGKWLLEPLKTKGIVNPTDQTAILYTMIYEFNEMLLLFAYACSMPNIVHVDCRGVAPVKDDWFDELHLESHKFKQISDVYVQCMDDFKKGKKTATCSCGHASQQNVYPV